MTDILKINIHPIIALLIIFLAFLFFLRWFESKAIYFPERNFQLLPSDFNLNYEDVFVTSSDGVKIHGWYLEKSPDAAVVLFFHGNGGNISHRIVKVDKLLNLNLNVFIFDWRGYGKSSGKPCEEGLYKDADAVYNWLLKKGFTGDRIIFFGESLGCAVAIETALRRCVSAVILESPFTSIKDMIKTHYKILYPFYFIVKHKYDNYQKISNINSPILIIHSTGDEIVPFGIARKLFDRAKEPKRFLAIAGGHNEGFLASEKEYMQDIKVFLSSYISQNK